MKRVSALIEFDIETFSYWVYFSLYGDVQIIHCTQIHVNETTNATTKNFERLPNQLSTKCRTQKVGLSLSKKKMFYLIEWKMLFISS